MTNPNPKNTAKVLLQENGQTFAQELDIPIERNNPSALFRLLCATQLFSARIQESIAVNAARAMADKGWNTPQKLLDTSWEDRVECLNQAGYTRYQERTATMLADASQLLVDRYDGDLRQLREAADRDIAKEHQLLTEFKGIGNVGANIFLREIQGIWDEVFPFADDRTLETAKDLGLPNQVAELQKLVSQENFPRLVAALVRVHLANHEAEVLAKAS